MPRWTSKEISGSHFLHGKRGNKRPKWKSFLKRDNMNSRKQGHIFKMYKLKRPHTSESFLFNGGLLLPGELVECPWLTPGEERRKLFVFQLLLDTLVLAPVGGHCKHTHQCWPLTPHIHTDRPLIMIIRQALSFIPLVYPSFIPLVY